MMRRLVPGLASKKSRARKQRLLMQEFGHLATLVNHDLPAAENGMRRIGFCARNPREGTSSVAANYANLCARQGLRTTMIEADLRTPSLADYFDVNPAPGLWEILEGTADVEEVLRTNVADGLNLISAGNPPKEILVAAESFDLSPVFDYLAPHNDIVVVDVPAITSAPEANLILPQMDGVVLVIEASRSRLCAITRVMELLDQLGVRVIGSVFNRARYDLPSVIDKLL